MHNFVLLVLEMSNYFLLMDKPGRNFIHEVVIALYTIKGNSAPSSTMLLILGLLNIYLNFENNFKKSIMN